MNKKQIVGLTNFLCIGGALLLVYWVFAFTLSSVFGFKVFRENITQLFGLSVLGILAMVASALVLNIALNLTRIAESTEGASLERYSSVRKIIVGLLVPFPLIAGFLYYGDQATTRKKEQFLVDSAKQVVAGNDTGIGTLANYSFGRDFVLKAGEILEVMKREDENFPSVALIVADAIDTKEVFLMFRADPYWDKKTEKTRADFIYSCSAEERAYLRSVFSQGNTKERFSSADNRYELYLPLQREGKTVLLYFSDYAEYGKYGS